MINHYTANRRRRNDDAYSPGGRIGLRPDRPTPVYAQRCHEAFRSVPVLIGGIEASLGRIAHYDYWLQIEYIRKGPRFITANSEIAFVLAEGTRVTTELRRALAEK